MPAGGAALHNYQLNMPSEKTRARRWYSHWLTWSILLAMLVGGGLATPWIKGRWRRWTADRQLRSAEAMLAEGDLKRAAMSARGVLNNDPNSVAATRIIIRALETVGSPEAAYWRSRLDVLLPGDAENIIAWAADTMKAGDLPATERVIKMLPPGAAKTARFHEIMAQVSAARQDRAAAENHWAEAARLDPKEDRYRLALAAMQIRSGDAGVREAAVQMLTALSENTPRNLKAVRILLAEALRMEEWKKAEALCGILAADPAATFMDKLDRLTALRRMNVQEAPSYLVELRDAALAKPDDLYTLLMWMNENRLSMMVADWARTLPLELTSTTPVSVALADAYARNGEWTRLRDYLAEYSWGDFDYLRRAFTARALEKLGDAELGAQEWENGLSSSRSRPDSAQRLERLARVAVTWGWEQRAKDLMWTLASSPGCPRWVLDKLWKESVGRSDASQLQKVAAMLAQADSKSVAFRNNSAFFSLLIRSSEGDPHREAARLFEENPHDADVAVTRGLSLYQQGKVADALEITSGLPPEDLKKPLVALYHAIFLTAAGEAAKAAEFLPVAQEREMFTEERSLLERAKLAARQPVQVSSRPR